MSLCARIGISLVSCAWFSLVNAAQQPISLTVDASEASRKIFHAQLDIPVSPGQLDLYYPKWIPGTHGPSNPIVELVGLKFSANGNAISWQRDLVDMYKFHCVIPAGINSLHVTLDYLSSSDPELASATTQLAAINWNQVLLYPAGKPANDIQFAARLKMPDNWKFGTALAVATQVGQTVVFKPVSLTTLIDSPVFIGQHFNLIDLTPNAKLNIFGDSDAAITLTAEQITHFKNVVTQANALFGAHHYNHYDFLLGLSDFIEPYGLEHHQSSDNRSKEKTFSDADLGIVIAGLLPHEMTHSWNGKYRRPADLTTPDYQTPMKTDMLWVYEGLTEYLGQLLTARSGLWTPEAYRENLAQIAGELSQKTGRTWRPLADTAISAQILYSARPEWANWRRQWDYYDEMVLIWLEADVFIRQHTQGRKSLDDFCKMFFGGKNGPPEVKTYTFDDIVKALNVIAANDWRNFFTTRLNSTAPHAPLEGIENSGWHLIFNDKPNLIIKGQEKWYKTILLKYSLGFSVKADGTIVDITPGMSAANAGLAPGMKMLAINGRRWSEDLLKDTIRATKKDSHPIELIVENGDYIRTYQLKYQGGMLFPHLERNTKKTDLLSEIIKPLG